MQWGQYMSNFSWHHHLMGLCLLATLSMYPLLLLMSHKKTPSNARPCPSRCRPLPGPSRHPLPGHPRRSRNPCIPGDHPLCLAGKRPRPLPATSRDPTPISLLLLHSSDLGAIRRDHCLIIQIHAPFILHRLILIHASFILHRLILIHATFSLHRLCLVLHAAIILQCIGLLSPRISPPILRSDPIII